MIIIKEIKFKDVFFLIKNLTEQHWDGDWRNAVDQFNVKEELYTQLSEQGLHKLFVAFEWDKPVGYCSFILAPSLHSEGNIATMDALFVDPKYRGNSIGERLLDSATDSCKSSGCTFITATFRSDFEGNSKLIENCGFKKEEIVYAKKI